MNVFGLPDEMAIDRQIPDLCYAQSKVVPCKFEVNKSFGAVA